MQLFALYTQYNLPQQQIIQLIQLSKQANDTVTSEISQIIDTIKQNEKAFQIDQIRKIVQKIEQMQTRNDENQASNEKLAVVDRNENAKTQNILESNQNITKASNLDQNWDYLEQRNSDYIMNQEESKQAEEVIEEIVVENDKNEAFVRKNSQNSLFLDTLTNSQVRNFAIQEIQNTNKEEQKYNQIDDQREEIRSYIDQNMKTVRSQLLTDVNRIQQQCDQVSFVVYQYNMKLNALLSTKQQNQSQSNGYQSIQLINKFNRVDNLESEVRALQQQNTEILSKLLEQQSKVTNQLSASKKNAKQCGQLQDQFLRLQRNLDTQMQKISEVQAVQKQQPSKQQVLSLEQKVSKLEQQIDEILLKQEQHEIILSEVADQRQKYEKQMQETFNSLEQEVQTLKQSQTSQNQSYIELSQQVNEFKQNILNTSQKLQNEKANSISPFLSFKAQFTGEPRVSQNASTRDFKIQPLSSFQGQVSGLSALKIATTEEKKDEKKEKEDEKKKGKDKKGDKEKEKEKDDKKDEKKDEKLDQLALSKNLQVKKAIKNLKVQIVNQEQEESKIKQMFQKKEPEKPAPETAQTESIPKVGTPEKKEAKKEEPKLNINEQFEQLKSQVKLEELKQTNEDFVAGFCELNQVTKAKVEQFTLYIMSNIQKVKNMSKIALFEPTILLDRKQKYKFQTIAQKCQGYQFFFFAICLANDGASSNVNLILYFAEKFDEKVMKCEENAIIDLKSGQIVNKIEIDFDKRREWTFGESEEKQTMVIQKDFTSVKYLGTEWKVEGVEVYWYQV